MYVIEIEDEEFWAIRLLVEVELNRMRQMKGDAKTEEYEFQENLDLVDGLMNKLVMINIDREDKK